MRLDARVLLANLLLLLVALLGSWALVGEGVLRPMIHGLMLERADIALYIAHQVEVADDPAETVAALADALQVEATVTEAPPAMVRRSRRHARRPLTIDRDGRRILLLRSKHTPIALPLRTTEGRQWLVVRFPLDLDAPPRRAGLALLILGTIALLTALVLTRWTLRPLETASGAMQRVADGDLGHRLPEGSGVTGTIGATFNGMAERVQGLVADQRKLMAAVSHELRTPLARMRLHAELLRDSGASPERITALEAEIAEIDDLIGELLESARLDQGVMALALTEVDLGDLTAEALGSVELGDRPVRLVVDRDLTVQADRRRLLRAVVNLLSNAARYTSPDAAISLLATRDGDEVRIEVADRGDGVAEASLPRLFDPFFREESSRSRATGGLGLGLMLVRQIVEAHGGSIHASNRDGGGLSVVMLLPS